MLTIFSCPKPFTDPHINIIQRNAIKSWTLLRPRSEIILIGDEEGTAEICKEFGLRHVPKVERNEYGTPLVSSVFQEAQNATACPLMCYANTDIILMSDFLYAMRQIIRHIRQRFFLVIGQRWDVDLKEPWDFGRVDWEKRLRLYVTQTGMLHPPGGIDYFVFPRGLYHNIPPFAIGRTIWDGWLVYRARTLCVPVIDATRAITAIHQNHDYLHEVQGREGIWTGPEARRNQKIAGRHYYPFTVRDATWVIDQQGLRRALTSEHLWCRLRALPALWPILRPLTYVAQKVSGKNKSCIVK